MEAELVDTLRPIALIALGVGLVFTTLGIVFMVRRRRFLRSAVRVPGVVTDVLYDPRVGVNGSGGLWFPILSFTTVDGHPVQTRAQIGRVPAPARTGDQVTVLYDPEDPTRASLPRDGSGCLAWIFTIVGVSSVTIGAALLVLVSVIET